MRTELADINAQCERALRRLRALARDHHDVLLSQALRSVKRAAELSAASVGDGVGRRTA